MPDEPSSASEIAAAHPWPDEQLPCFEDRSAWLAFFGMGHPMWDIVESYPNLLSRRWPAPHDHKGFSEEKCIRCGWVMGHQALNCNNDDTPHVFPSQVMPS